MNDESKTLATIIRHRDLLRLNMQRLAHDLERRGLAHDLSKLRADEAEGFVRINAAAREHPYGSPEYKAALASEAGPNGCIGLHYSRNSHHPEFHPEVASMGFLDIIEMVMDWKAAADGYGNTPFRDGIARQRDRFRFTDAQWWLIEQVAEFLERGA